VGAHLHRIYARLGINGRGKLAAALADLHDEQPEVDLADRPA
jgi:DNA-binding CsgD family transcriptional regulator